MTYVKWFKTEKEAQRYQEQHGGMLCKNKPRSRSKHYHLLAADVLGFDPVAFPFSIQKNEV